MTCRAVLLRCLKLAAVPYLTQVWLWVFQGRLEASPSNHPEFFIVRSMVKDEKGETLELARLLFVQRNRLSQLKASSLKEPQVFCGSFNEMVDVSCMLSKSNAFVCGDA